MDARHFPLVEYETQPAQHFEAGAYVWAFWRARQTIDLRWIASARPWEEHYCEVHLCGAGLSAGIIVRCGYADFCQDWARAKGVA